MLELPCGSPCVTDGVTALSCLTQLQPQSAFSGSYFTHT